MAGKAAPRRKRITAPKEKQTFIPGTAPERVKPVEDAATRYVTFRDERLAAGEQEAKLKKKLIEAMKEHSLETYNFDGFMVELEHITEDDVKVKKARAAKENGQEAAK